MNSKILLPALVLCVIFASPSVNAARDYYQRHRPSCASKVTISDVSTIDPRFESKINYNQYGYGTCYGFASYYALQYLYNKSNNLEDVEESLSVLDVLGKGCRKEWRTDGGWPYAVLHNIRQEDLNKISLGSYPAKYSTLLRHADSLKVYHGRPESCGECCEFLNNNILTKTVTQSLDKQTMLKIIKMEQDSGSSDTFPYRVIDGLNREKRVGLPAYNLYHYQANSKEDHLNKVRDLFSSENKAPLIISFCTKEKVQGVCEDDSFHATAITGVRKTCCAGQCSEEWYINNSYGANRSVHQSQGIEQSEHGWHSAADLADSMATYGSSTGLTYILPCSEKYGQNLPICTNYIHSRDPWGHLASTQDLKSRERFEMNKPDIRSRTEWTPFEAAVANGDLNTVNFFLNRNIPMSQLTPAGLSPLALAVERNDLDIMKALLKGGADPNEKVGNSPSPIQVALLQKDSKAKELLLSHVALQKKPENRFDKGGWTDLTRAARDGDHASLISLVARGADIDFTNSNGWTALNLAAFKGHVEIVKLLLSKKANPNSKSFSGYTPLWSASLAGHKDVLKALVEGGSDINELGKDGFSPLNIAANAGHHEIVNFLMDRKGLNLNTRDTSGMSALHHAAHQNHVDVVSSLLRGKDIDLDIRNRSGYTPLMLALIKNNDLVVRKLLKAGADPSLIAYDGQTPWSLALNRKLDHKSLQALQDGIDKIYDKFDINGETSLTHAAKIGQLDDLKSLVKKGVSLDFPNSKGKHALFIAAAEGHEDLVRFLLEQGADPNKKSQNGFNSLMVPVLSGKAAIVRLLAPKMKKEIDGSGADGMTALHHASALGLHEIVQTLLDSGASVSQKNSQGLTPLTVAILTGKTEVVKVLANSKNSILNSDSGRSIPLEQAVKRGNIEMVKILLKAGANAKSPEVMASAKEFGNREILDLILKHKK
jgi:ankyrin repeat protein